MADEPLFVLFVVFIDLLNKLIKYMYTHCNSLNRKSVNNRNISNKNSNDSNSVPK